MKNSTEKKYFECFSINLHDFILSKGIEHDRTYVHNRTKVLCHVYKITPELSEALMEWKHTSPKMRAY